MSDLLTRHGFTFGPAEVTRICHLDGRGYVLEVKTEHAQLQILISEKGRRITTYPINNARESRRES